MMRWLALLLALNLAHHLRGEKWDCLRPWPELDLFLPVGLRGSRAEEWKDLFLRTYLLHWPVKLSQTKLLLLLDEEQRDSPEVKDALQYISKFPKLRNMTAVQYNNPDPVYYNHQGHNRQQLLMFYADNYTSSEFVGFVDTDTFFVTYVDREDLFENGKPVVNGKIGNTNKRGSHDPLWQDITATSYEVLGVPEPMKCMAYFPVIIRTEHLAALRKYLEERFGMPFYEVFMRKIVPRRYSQFNLFCTFLWHFRHSDYAWYAHDMSPEWDFANPPPIYGQLNDSRAYTSAMRFPKPLVAGHARYHSPNIIGRGHTRMREFIMQGGICFSPPFPKPATRFWRGCYFYRSEEDHRNEIYDEMFKFEWSDYTTTVGLGDIQAASYSRFQRIQHCNHSYESEGLEDVMGYWPGLAEGDVVYTPQTGRQVWAMVNESRWEFPNFDTFVALGYVDKPKKKISYRELRNIPIGGTFAACTNC